MEFNESIIIRIIQQDMKHHQLTAGICHIGFETEMHHSDVSGIVAELMGTTLTDPWLKVYMDHLVLSERYPITHRAASLRCLARDCYTALLAAAQKT